MAVPPAIPQKNRGQALLFEAMAFALGGMFLLAGNIAFPFGWIFIAFAIFLIVESLLNKFFSKHDWIHNILSYPLFLVTGAEFIIESIKPQRDLYVIVAIIFLIVLTVADAVQTYRVFRDRAMRSKI